MNKNYFNIFRAIFLLLLFVIFIQPAQAQIICIDGQDKDKARHAGDYSTAFCKYEKYFYAKDENDTSKYKIYSISVKNDQVHYQGTGIFGALYFTPVFFNNDIGKYYTCDGASTTTPDTNFYYPWSLGDSHNDARVTILRSNNFPYNSRFSQLKEYPTIYDVWQWYDVSNRKYYDEWLTNQMIGKKEDGIIGNFCPPYIVVGGIASISGNPKDSWAYVMGSLSEATSEFNTLNNDTKYTATPFKFDPTDYLKPREYVYTSEPYSYMEILPLVKTDRGRVDFNNKVDQTGMNEVSTEESQMVNIADQLYTYSKACPQNVPKDKLAAEIDALTKKVDGKQLIEKVKPLLAAGQVKLINAQNKGFGGTYKATDYSGYRSLASYYQMTDIGGDSATTDKIMEKLDTKIPTDQIISDYLKQLCKGSYAQEYFTKLDELNDCIETGHTAQCDQTIDELNNAAANYSSYTLQYDEVLDPIPIDCNDFADVVKFVFRIIMIIAPILVIVLGTVDFAKATLSDDESAIKKAGMNFGKRVIAAIILFLLPLLIDVILGIAVDAGIIKEKPQTCLTDNKKD